MNTSDFARHDLCPRFRTWSSKYELPRIPISEALNTSLRAALLSGDHVEAYRKFMQLSSNPGLDIEGYNIYDIAIHHAQMIEVLACYLITDGPWKPAEAISFGGDIYEPLSYQLPDGRIRRVVLCSSWGNLREHEERTSWWTVGDIAVTGRPMLVNVLVIGSAKGGFRQSPWTTGYIHPENGTLRIKKRDGKFTERWKKVYREQIGKNSNYWISKMQQDVAFDEIVYSFTVDSVNKEVISDMKKMVTGFGGTDMRRSGCFRSFPCTMSEICHHDPPLTPSEANWKEKCLVGLDK